MHTSAGIAEEDTDRSGRSGQPLPAAAAQAAPTAIKAAIRQNRNRQLWERGFISFVGQPAVAAAVFQAAFSSWDALVFDRTEAPLVHLKNLFGIRNDYNRRYPEAFPFRGGVVWFRDVISASWP
jgi:hypothetical protein